MWFLFQNCSSALFYIVDAMQIGDGLRQLVPLTTIFAQLLLSGD